MTLFMIQEIGPSSFEFKIDNNSVDIRVKVGISDQIQCTLCKNKEKVK